MPITMCGRYVLASEIKAIAKRFGLDTAELELSAQFNVAPGQAMPVIRRKTKNEAELMRWGLIPPWAKEINIGYKMINARSETILEKTSFRKPIKSQRCIVPASGFYEWQKSAQAKVPYFIHLKEDPLFGFAGLYDVWKDVTGREIRSFTILTTEANEAIKHIHDRMPVILTPDAEEAWLDSDKHEVKEVVGFLKPYPAEQMEAYPVSKNVNSARNNSPDLISRVQEEPSLPLP